MTLVRIAKDWDWPNLLRQTPLCKGVWDGVEFTLDPVEECDYLIMLNNRMKETITVRCLRENIWALMQEPYMSGHNDWMVEGHENFFKVFTHHIPDNDARYIVSPPAIPWHVNKTFDQLISSAVPEKPKLISWVVGDAADLPGHMKRLSFLRFLQHKSTLDIDLFGRAVQYIEDKWDGLAPYRYSLAIENSSSDDYWTEKLADCFLAWSLPFYYGCTNLEKYFPEESFIRIDINQPEESLQRVKAIIREDDWEKRIPAIKKARDLVLHKYQLFPYVGNLINSQPKQSGEKALISIPPYKKSARALFFRAFYKLKKKLGEP